MDPKERLRRYLEQRRETGERELILDGMSVEDVMRILGATAASSAVAPPSVAHALRPTTGEPRAPGESRADSSSDWREVLRGTGSGPGRPSTPVREAPPPERPIDPDEVDELDAAGATEIDVRQQPGQPELPVPVVATQPSPPLPPAPDAPPGIVVGTASRELFGGPLGAVKTLEELAEVIAKCTRCPLYKTATKPVPGTGSATAELVCVGEAPGEAEDKSGHPFVGPAGQLLTKILAAINLRREDVFICNVLKHRPPGNRNPMPMEVEACSPYLVRQLEIIRPKVIVAFGTFAAQTLLETKLSIGKLRGSVHRYHGIPLVVTYHPAALLRNPAWKRPTWEDVQLARRVLDRAPGA
jgi:uracil-DNA glycosylase family 4